MTAFAILALCTVPVTDAPIDTVEKIDVYWQAVWKAERITPAKPCTDAEYLRRLTLDLLGRIPTLDEFRAFERDRRADKRGRLVHRLLAHPEYARYWSHRWTDWLLPPTIPQADRVRFRPWMEQRLRANTLYNQWVPELLTASGSPSENPAVLFLGNHLGQRLPPSRWEAEGQYDMIPIVQRSTDLFLEIDLRCVQCHDHPYLERWQHKHFWQIACFFRQLQRLPKKPGEFELRDNPKLHAKGYLHFEKRNGLSLAVKAVFLDGSVYNSKDKRTKRQAFADRLVIHPNFARAYVHRMWTHFLGRPLERSPLGNDLGNEQTPIAHLAFLDQLSAAFVSVGYDTNQLIYWICKSRPYNLSSTPSKPQLHAPFADDFATMQRNPLDAHRFSNSLLTALGISATSAEGRRLCVRWKTELAQPHVEPTCEAHLVTSRIDPLQRSLWMINGDSLHNELSRADGTLRSVSSKPRREAITTLYRAALTREPTDTEWRALGRTLELDNKLPRTASDKALEDLFWALLASGEFGFQH